jgi:glycosyltransferase involved in cell wall biosynthesis
MKITKGGPKRRDLRITWLSNAIHANSGYSVFSRDLLFRMIKDGWPVAQVCNFGVQGYHVTLHGEDLIDDRFKDCKLKVYPVMNDPYGSDALLEHSKDFNANVAFVMLDLFTQNPQILSQLKTFIPYIPIDKSPTPPMILDRLKYAYKILTFSDFGKETLLDSGYTSRLILEGTDTEIFKPLDKKEMRKKFGLPENAFLFGMIAANKENPPRKGFQEALEAFKLFSDKHPEAMMFFHSQQMTPGGFPIQQYAQQLKIADKCWFINPYVGVFKSDSHNVVEEMNCFDVLMHPSHTEGFGLTVVEAAACGIPAIVNNCTSMPEMIIPGKTGEVCKTSGKFFDCSLSYTHRPDVQDLYEKMEKLYVQLHEKNTIAKDCRDLVLEKYDINKIYENQWKPLLESLQEEILPLKK